MGALKPRTWEEIDSRRFDPYSLFRRSALSQTGQKYILVYVYFQTKIISVFQELPPQIVNRL
jgi:hypothetical protein